jgi:hypothetical protein
MSVIHSESQPRDPKPGDRKPRGFHLLGPCRSHRRLLERNVFRAYGLPVRVPSLNGCLPSFTARGRMTAVVLDDGRRRAVDRGQLGTMNHPMHARRRRRPRQWLNHARRPRDRERSVLKMCDTCKSDSRDMWSPCADLPTLVDVRHGNWVSLQRCPTCSQLWMTSPFEPYASFTYMVKWPRTIEDWVRIHDVDGASTLHEWMKNEIRRLYPSAAAEDRKRIDAHEDRSYGHYSLTRSIDTNPIVIATL